MTLPINLKTNSLLDILYAQASDKTNYPNIALTGYENLNRSLNEYLDVNYGFNGFGIAQSSSGGIHINVQYLVISVQGQDSTVTTPQSVKSIIFLANHVFSPPPNFKMTLNTPKNQNVEVTVKEVVGNGAISVYESLIEDISTIKIYAGRTKNTSGNAPYVQVGLDLSSGGLTSWAGGQT